MLTIGLNRSSLLSIFKAESSRKYVPGRLFVEIEDTKEIRRLNNALSAKLRNALVHSETRTIGYPRGTFKAEVHFLSSSGNNVFYWSGGPSDDKSVSFNFFGHGAPRTTATLNIDIQFTLPLSNFLGATEARFFDIFP